MGGSDSVFKRGLGIAKRFHAVFTGPPALVFLRGCYPVGFHEESRSVIFPNKGS